MGRKASVPNRHYTEEFKTEAVRLALSGSSACDDYAVSRMCRLLAVSRAGYLQWRHRPPSARAQANARLDVQVAAMHAQPRAASHRSRAARAGRAGGT
jgi:transposase-like protein